MLTSDSALAASALTITGRTHVKDVNVFMYRDKCSHATKSPNDNDNYMAEAVLVCALRML